MRWTREPGRLVVGVDGSDASVEALVFALREASAVGATVEVLSAWWFEAPHSTRTAGMGSEAHERAQDMQDRAVATALTAAEVPSPVIARVLVEEEPVAALLSASRGASCLILGRGRRGAVRSGAVGSVTERCIRAARCPVIVVPPQGEEHEPEDETAGTRAPAPLEPV